MNINVLTDFNISDFYCIILTEDKFIGVNMRTKKISLFIMIMVLGASAISVDSVFAGEIAREGVKIQTPNPVPYDTEKQELDIRANRETLAKAKYAMENKDYQSAVVYLSGYISEKPKRYEVYKMRGECFYALRQYSLAEKDFQTAVKLKTDDDKFVTGTKVFGAMVLGADKQDQYQNPELGNLYAELMYAQKAQNKPEYETSYQSAVQYNSHIYLPQPLKKDISKINCPQKYGKKLNAQGIDSFIYGAIDDISNKNFHEAMYKIQRVTSEFPRYYLGHYLTGVISVGLEQDQEAISSFETSLKYNPYDFESLASLGQIYYNEAEKTFSADSSKKSIDYFTKALKYNKNCHMYLYYIGLNHLLTGDLTQAISNFDMAIQTNPNDYNSIYYKSIAQYLNGDYSGTIAGAEKLLYRHVSNYNSVLYLKALAEYKTGDNQTALSDIEKIQQSVNDIYNSDIKKLSDKEKKLESYIFYLKSKIDNSANSSDLKKALENPIIAELSNYKQSQVADANFVVTSDDFEKQYDYIRTTFSDLGLSFTYLNPNYKVSTSATGSSMKISPKTVENEEIKGFDVVVKPAEKSDNEINLTEKSSEEMLAQDTIAKELAQKHVSVKSDDDVTELTKSTNPMDTLVNDNQTSIAKILASNSLPKTNQEESIYDNSISGMPVKEVYNTLDTPEMVEPKNKIAVVETTKDIEIITEDKTLDSPVEKVIEDVDSSDGYRIVAPVQKPAEQFTISYQNVEPKVEEIVSEPKENNISDEVKIITDDTQKSDDLPKSIVKSEYLSKDLLLNNESNTSTVSIVEDTDNEPKVVEKFANVDLDKYEIKKTAPEIKDTDEIIVYEPNNNLINKAQADFKNDISAVTSRNSLKSTYSYTEIQKDSASIIVKDEVKSPTANVIIPTPVANPTLEEPKSVQIPDEFVVTSKILDKDAAVEDSVKTEETNEAVKNILKVIDVEPQVEETIVTAPDTEIVLDTDSPIVNDTKKVKNKKLKKSKKTVAVNTVDDDLKPAITVIEDEKPIKKAKKEKIKPLKTENDTELTKESSERIVQKLLNEDSEKKVSKKHIKKQELLNDEQKADKKSFFDIFKKSENTKTSQDVASVNSDVETIVAEPEKENLFKRMFNKIRKTSTKKEVSEVTEVLEQSEVTVVEILEENPVKKIKKEKVKKEKVKNSDEEKSLIDVLLESKTDKLLKDAGITDEESVVPSHTEKKVIKSISR